MAKSLDGHHHHLRLVTKIFEKNKLLGPLKRAIAWAVHRCSSFTETPLPLLPKLLFSTLSPLYPCRPMARGQKNRSTTHLS